MPNFILPAFQYFIHQWDIADSYLSIKYIKRYCEAFYEESPLQDIYPSCNELKIFKDLGKHYGLNPKFSINHYFQGEYLQPFWEFLISFGYLSKGNKYGIIPEFMVKSFINLMEKCYIWHLKRY
jgi:hypothetical protein